MTTGPTGAAAAKPTQTELEQEAGRKALERRTAQSAVPVAPQKASGAANVASFPLDRAGNDPVDTGITEAFAALAKTTPKIALSAPSGPAATEQKTCDRETLA